MMKRWASRSPLRSAPAGARLEDSDARLAELQNEVRSLRDDVQRLTSVMQAAHHHSHVLNAKREKIEAGLPRHLAEVRPTVESASIQPTHICEMNHFTLAHLAVMDNHHAHRERLIREIMSVDGMSWEEAHEVLDKM